MKKMFEEPEVLVIRLEANDIVCASGCTGVGGNDTQDDCLAGE